jgi:hypothetical protein
MNARQLFGTLGISVVLACGILLPTSALANGAPERQGLEGTWMTGIANATNAVPFLGLTTYTQDGQCLDESNSTASRSLGHGEWFKIGPHEYFRSTVNFRFAPPPAEPRTFIGLSRISAKLVLNESGDEYTGQAVIERFDINGNLTETIFGTEAGRRCDSSTSMKRCLGIGN